MDESLQNIRDYNKDQSARNERDIKQAQLVDAITQSQQVQVRSMQMLVDYLDNHVSKTEVVNQLLEVGTPDAYKVVEAVNMLEQTVSDQEPADLSEITALLRSVLQETEKIPKSHNDIKIPEQVDNSDKLEKLESAIKAVDASIKAQKLVAEAPIVNVPEAVVNVDKPDLSPIEQEQKKTRTDLVKAIKGIVIPKTDIKPLEKELKKLNKLFNEFVEYGTGSSGGGGGGGVLLPLIVTERFDSAGGYDYIGEAPVGTGEAESAWTITRYSSTEGKVALSVAWNDRIGAIYG